MFATININLDQQISPRNFVAQLAQPPPRRRGPKRGELFGAEFDFAFFPGCASAYFECQRRGFAFFAHAHLPACRLRCQITLRDDVTSRTLEFFRQPLKQIFAFDFATVWHFRLHSRKVRMLLAITVPVAVAAGANALRAPNSCDVRCAFANTL